jgi:3-hydroxyacyl-[acyl-carrier-protein] dehydratase
LFLERCIECEDLFAVGEHTFGEDETFFTGHFPGRPIVPGVILIEGLAQTLAYLALTRVTNSNVLLTGVDHCRIRRAVLPGETVTYRIDVEKHRTKVVVAQGTVHVDGQLALSARLMGFIVPHEPNSTN